jgi:hypothetical protein
MAALERTSALVVTTLDLAQKTIPRATAAATAAEPRYLRMRASISMAAGFAGGTRDVREATKLRAKLV